MKLMRKSLMVLLAVLFMLTVGAFAVACSSDTITLSFVSDGPVKVEDIVVKKRAEVTLPEAGAWADHEFGGWYLNSDRTGTSYSEKQTITAPDADTTYYAKWDQFYTVTLDLNGGSGADVTTLKLKVGENVYNAVSNVKTPTKTGLTFGAWFYNGAELASTLTMPSNDITLKAEWKVEYTINVYLQNEDLTEYELSATHRRPGTDYVGKDITVAANVISGYKFNESYTLNITNAKLSENSANNVFKLYYDREQYRVFYNPNVPEGYTATGSLVDGGVYYYGETHKILENTYIIDGCRFAGWSASPAGDIITDDEITVNKSITLYAQWNIGYRDIGGSSDVLFFLGNETEDSVILNRGGLEFKGTRDVSKFTVQLPGGNTLTGTFLNNNLFCYDPTLSNGTYTYKHPYAAYYETLGKTVPEVPAAKKNNKVVIDGDSITVTWDGQTYADCMLVSFYEFGYQLVSQSVDKTIFLNVWEEGEQKYCTAVGEYEFALSLTSAHLMAKFSLGGELLADQELNGEEGFEKVIELDGKGNLYFTYGKTNEDGVYQTYARKTGYYTIEDTLPFYQSGQWFDLSIVKGCIVDADGTTQDQFEFLSFPYSQAYYLAVSPNELAGEFTATGSSAKLVLDGYVGTATYNGIKGLYATSYSAIYGTILTFQNPSTRATTVFLIDLEQKTYEVVSDSDANKMAIVNRSTLFEYDLVTYTAPTGDEEEGTYTFGEYVIVLAANSNDASIFEKSALNSFNYASPTAKGTYTTTPTVNGNVIYTFTATEGGKEFTFVTSSRILADELGFTRDIFYVLSVDGEAKGKKIEGAAGTIEYRDYGNYPLGATYTDTYGNVYEGGFLLFDDEEDTFFHDKNAGYFAYGNYNTGDMEYLFFIWDKTGDSGLEETYSESALVTLSSRGTVNEEITMVVRYNVTNDANDALYIDDDGKEIIGTLIERGQTDYGSILYTFTAEGIDDFNFSATEYNISGNTYLAWTKQDTTYSGKFTSEDGSVLELDGYDHATYLSVGYNLEGAYILYEKNKDGTTPVYYFGYDSVTEQSYYFYFVVNTDVGTFYEVDAIYQGDAQMKIVKSGPEEEELAKVYFDGLGRVTVYKDGTKVGEGDYERIYQRYLEAKVTLDEAVDGLGKEFTLGFSDYAEDDGEWARTAILKDAEGERCYVNAAGDVIWLNGYGDITITYADKTVVEGEYTIENNTLTVTVEAQTKEEQDRTITITLKGAFENDKDYKEFEFVENND